MKKFLIAASLLASSFSASAAAVSADFITEGDLPYCCVRSGPVIYQTLGAPIGSGVEHAPSQPTSNPSNWLGGLVYVDYKPETNAITLTAQDDLDFETYGIKINNLVFNAGEVVSGVSLVSNNLTDPTIVPTFSFTSNSVFISFNTGSAIGGFEFVIGQTAVFKVTVSQGNVPVPGAALLVALGLVAMALKGAKRK